MTFNAAIEKIMPEVETGSTERFIIYRDKNSDWHSDFIHNQYGELFDWVEDAREQDPFFVQYTGKEFANGSFPYVFDAVLCQRLQMERYYAESSGIDKKAALALVNFFEDYCGEFSHTVMDYLTTLDRPFAALSEMCPNMATGREGWLYNENLAWDAIDYIETSVAKRLHNAANIGTPDKNNVTGRLGYNEPLKKEQTQKKPATFQDKLNAAKKKSAEQVPARKGGHDAIPKKRGERG